MDPFEQAHEMFCVDTMRENTPCDGAYCRVGIALRAIYRAGLKRAVELFEEANRQCALEGCDRPLWNFGKTLRAELGDDDE